MKTDTIKNKDIAEYVKKSIDTINGWKQRQPELLESVRLGIFCKKNNISIEMIKNCVKLQELAKGEDVTNG